MQGVYNCCIEGCGHQRVQFKTTQLVFEEVHDVEGGRTRAVCFVCWERDKAIGNKSLAKHIKVRANANMHQQREIVTLDVEGDGL